MQRHNWQDLAGESTPMLDACLCAHLMHMVAPDLDAHKTHKCNKSGHLTQAWSLQKDTQKTNVQHRCNKQSQFVGILFWQWLASALRTMHDSKQYIFFWAKQVVKVYNIVLLALFWCTNAAKTPHYTYLCVARWFVLYHNCILFVLGRDSDTGNVSVSSPLSVVQESLLSSDS